MEQDIDLRYTEVSDLPDLQRWLLDPRVHAWMPLETEKEIEDTAKGWISFSRFHCSLTATYDGVVCGIGTLFLMPYRKVAHHCLIKIVVDPTYQRKGVGSDLLKNLKNLAKKHFRLESIQMEIFEGNPIEHLLQAQGFFEVLRQDRFVKIQDRYLARILYESVL